MAQASVLACPSIQRLPGMGRLQASAVFCVTRPIVPHRFTTTLHAEAWLVPQTFGTVVSALAIMYVVENHESSCFVVQKFAERKT
jgi:hypothetical protein